MCFLAFPYGSAGKESACDARDLGLIPGLGRCPEKGKGYPLQYSDLENFMNCIVHGLQRVANNINTFILLVFIVSNDISSWTSLIAQLVKNPPAMQEIPVQFVGQKDPLEKG